MKTTPDAPQSGIEWLGQQLRATIFHTAGDVEGNIHDYWARAFGAAPQQDETRNLEGVRIVGGQVDDKQWMSNIRPGRVDIVLQPANPPTPGSSDVWNKFGRPYQHVTQELIEPSHLLIDIVSGVNRLAIGAILLAPSSGVSEAFATLDSVLPGLRLRDLDAPDFSFRVNRRRRSQHSTALRVNRLATWSIAQGQTVSFGPVGSGAAMASESEIRYAAHLQLDINTANDDVSRHIPADKAKAILTELVEMATEIAKNGDIS